VKGTEGSQVEILLLLVLLVGAVAVFLPGILKERTLDSPLDTVSDFRRGMTVLALSTHNRDHPGGGYCLSSGGQEPEPYFRRSSFRGQEEDYSYEEDDFVPYPSNRAKAVMETRRHRIIAVLLIVALGTGIASLVPGLNWIIPVHIVMLVILAVYTFLVLLLPYYNRRR